MPDPSQRIARYAELYRVPTDEVRARLDNPWRTLADVIRPSIVLSLCLFVVSIPCAARRAVRRSLASLIGAQAAAIVSIAALAAIVMLEIGILAGRLHVATFLPTAMFLSAALLIPFLLAFFPASRSVDRMREWFGALTGQPFDQLLLQARLALLKRAARAAASQDPTQPVSKR